MRVVQLSDLHLGPVDHEINAAMNRRAWDNARQVAARLNARADAESLVIVITGDLTDNGHRFPAEYGPAGEWLATLPGTVRVVPGNHDVGNFATAPMPSNNRELICATNLEQWRETWGDDHWAHAADGHRLVGINSMLLGSGLDAEAAQWSWLEAQLDEADGAGEGVWVFQHAPLFLRRPDEVREAREEYWCPAAPPRDRMLARAESPLRAGAKPRARPSPAGRGSRRGGDP